MFARAIVIVLDSAGIGELPDAGLYGDEGSNTVGNIASSVGLAVPNLAAMGLSHLVSLKGAEPSPAPSAAYGRLAERSAGKDSVTGHWELMGVVLDRPFPTFPSGFPKDLIDAFEARIGRRSLGNVVASGTEIIDALGARHLETGFPIVYTSADSVFQIAAHEGTAPIAQQYEWCKIAYELAVEGMGMGRVIARPFVGKPGAFSRTSNRHDYAMPPLGETLLDRLTAKGHHVSAVGKISDLFAARGVAESHPTKNDAEGVDIVEALIKQQERGFIFANLVDFDTLYGHRNDVKGYAENLERFDRRVPGLMSCLREDDLLVFTADHGNDPTTPSTDHSREHVPLLLAGKHVRAGANLGTRSTFADLGQTLADVYGVGRLAHGESFLPALSLPAGRR